MGTNDKKNQTWKNPIKNRHKSNANKLVLAAIGINNVKIEPIKIERPHVNFPPILKATKPPIIFLIKINKINKKF